MKGEEREQAQSMHHDLSCALQEERFTDHRRVLNINYTKRPGG